MDDPMETPKLRFLTFRELALKGVNYTQSHISRLVEAGQFPAPVRLGPRRTVWPEAEVDSWVAERFAERNARYAGRGDTEQPQQTPIAAALGD